MVKALEDNKPLTDDVFGLPDGVDYWNHKNISHFSRKIR
jgi:hypothetical protein